MLLTRHFKFHRSEMNRIFFILLTYIFCGTLSACSLQDIFGYFSLWGNSDSAEQSQLQDKSVYLLRIDPNYLIYIIEGKKTSEGRLDLPNIDSIQEGDLVLFYDVYRNIAACTVGRVTRYPTFERMLVSEGVYNMLPQIDPATNSSIEMVVKGVAIYDSFPGYQEGVKEYGAIAFTISYEDMEIPESYLIFEIND